MVRNNMLNAVIEVFMFSYVNPDCLQTVMSVSKRYRKGFYSKCALFSFTVPANKVLTATAKKKKITKSTFAVSEQATAGGIVCLPVCGEFIHCQKSKLTRHCCSLLFICPLLQFPMQSTHKDSICCLVFVMVAPWFGKSLYHGLIFSWSLQLCSVYPGFKTSFQHLKNQKIIFFKQ